MKLLVIVFLDVACIRSATKRIGCTAIRFVDTPVRIRVTYRLNGIFVSPALDRVNSDAFAPFNFTKHWDSSHLGVHALSGGISITDHRRERYRKAFDRFNHAQDSTGLPVAECAGGILVRLKGSGNKIFRPWRVSDRVSCGVDTKIPA